MKNTAVDQNVCGQVERVWSNYLPWDHTQPPLSINIGVVQNLFRICNSESSLESAAYSKKVNIYGVPAPCQCKKHNGISIYLSNTRELSFVSRFFVCFRLVVKFLLLLYFLQMKRLGFDEIKWYKQPQGFAEPITGRCILFWGATQSQAC